MTMIKQELGRSNLSNDAPHKKGKKNKGQDLNEPIQKKEIQKPVKR